MHYTVDRRDIERGWCVGAVCMASLGDRRYEGRLFAAAVGVTQANKRLELGYALDLHKFAKFKLWP